MTVDQSDATQPPRHVPGYRKSLLRSPLAPSWPRVAPVEVPASFGAELVTFPPTCDLSVISPGRPRALGQLIVVTGRIVDEAGRPIRHALLECWQANSAGKYIHPADPSPVPVDPNFEGVGRIVTDAEGRYQLRTIKPGGYAVPYDGDGQLAGWWRPPHIHFSIFGDGFGKRLVTQMYFPGEPLNAYDLLLNSIRDERARSRLVSAFDPDLSTADGALGYSHDFVLGGSRETPLEDDHP